jgi:hypothetical protein
MPVLIITAHRVEKITAHVFSKQKRAFTCVKALLLLINALL